MLAESMGKLSLIKRLCLAVVGVTGFLIFAGCISSSFKPTHAEEVQISTLFGTGSLQLSDAACGESTNQPAYDPENNLLNMSGLTNTIISNCLRINATTENEYGYTLTLDGPDSGNLTLGDAAISNKDGSIAAPTVFAAQTTGGAWGFAIPSGQLKGTVLTGGKLANGFDSSYEVLPAHNTTNTAKYAPVPTSATAISKTTEANSTLDSYDIYFAAAAGEYMPTGNYTGTITISGVGNGKPVPPTDMQTIPADNCPTERTMVRDARDNNTYWIRKIDNTASGGGARC